MIDILVVEKSIRLVVIGLGVLVICLPLARLWQSRDALRGRSSGSRVSWTRWSGAVILAIIYISVGILLWKPILLHISLAMRIALLLIGVLVYLPGITLYLWGFETLGSMFGVSTIKGAQLYQQHQIIESGPYAFFRHPMYIGVILAAIGAFLLFRTWAMALFTPTAFSVILRAHREEELLAREFGASWIDYCARVPAWIPRFIYRKVKTRPQVNN
jgi:protein-S-isoprenylcysteine O-methyltransferase Ste14